MLPAIQEFTAASYRGLRGLELKALGASVPMRRSIQRPTRGRAVDGERVLVETAGAVLGLGEYARR